VYCIARAEFTLGVVVGNGFVDTCAFFASAAAHIANTSITQTTSTRFMTVKVYLTQTAQSGHAQKSRARKRGYP